MDSELGFASFLRAVGEYNLNQLNEAERCAQAAEKNPHEDNPQVHALLAQIYVTQQGYLPAATGLREPERPERVPAPAPVRRRAAVPEATVSPVSAPAPSPGSAPALVAPQTP
jgi:hypothetical protein